MKAKTYCRSIPLKLSFSVRAKRLTHESCYFEGNYGNMMDESMAPSNTPPCNAVYDGCNYYYLPWSSEKPCVCVESYWENIAFRLEPLNALLKIIDRVVRLAIALISLYNYFL